MTRTRFALPIVTLVLVASMIASLSTAAPAAVQTLSLTEAISQGLVEARFTATGNASGAAIRVEVRRTTLQDLSLGVTAGLLLLNTLAGEQDMVARQVLGETFDGRRYNESTAIDLFDDAEHTYILEGYCLEATEENPSDGSVLIASGLAGTDVVRVLQAASVVPDADEEIAAIQAAVWAITDDFSREEMEDVGYDLTDGELEIARALILAAGLDPAAYRLFSEG